MTFTGPWPAGPIQKVVVALLALRMEAAGLHPFHASAVRYRDRTILFLGGESNHGKCMGQIEACRRGARLVSTETTVIDETGIGRAGLEGSRSSRSGPRAPSGPTRPPQRRAWPSSSATMPSWELHTEPSPVDVVVVPAIDGNYAPSCAPMIPFERQFQTFHSVQNYFLAQRAAGAGHRDADRRPRPPCGPPGPTSSSASASGPSSSSGQPPRRCCSTKSTGSSRARRIGRRCAPSATSGRPTLAEAVGLLADARPRRAAPGRRDRPAHPAARRDAPAAGRGRPQADRRARRPASASGDGR